MSTEELMNYYETIVRKARGLYVEFYRERSTHPTDFTPTKATPKKAGRK